MTSEVRLEIADGIATLSLDAPQRRNALTASMARAVVEACEEIDARTDVGAAIVRGDGPAFCAGAHRDLLARVGEDPASTAAFDELLSVYRSFTRVGELGVPTIAAVRGSAVGAGLNLALATDVRIVAYDASLVSGFLPIGAHPGGGHFGLLERTGGRDTAAAMGLFGERIDGREAVARGLAWVALAEEDVDERARALAGTVANDPALARHAARSFRTELGPPALSWEAGLMLEHAPQLWSLRRQREYGR